MPLRDKSDSRKFGTSNQAHVRKSVTNTNEWRVEAIPIPPPPEPGRTGTYRDHGRIPNGCNLLITTSLNPWRRGESNHDSLLKIRNLLETLERHLRHLRSLPVSDVRGNVRG